MIKDYLEKNLGSEVSDEEFSFAGAIVKNFIMGECGGVVSLETKKELMLEAIIKLRGYKLFKFEEWA